MKHTPTPIADLLEREARLVRIAEIVYRNFRLQFTEEQKKHFLATGTFCPNRPAAVESGDQGPRRGGKRKETRR